jgi:hypothetical protein
MNNHITRSSNAAADAKPGAPADAGVDVLWHRVTARRSFLKGVGLASAAAVPGSALLANSAVAKAATLTAGDVAILRFLAAAELIESDLWQQ